MTMKLKINSILAAVTLLITRLLHATESGIGHYAFLKINFRINGLIFYTIYSAK